MINNVILVGRLTKDVDLKYTQGGNAVGTFNLAVNRNFTNAEGNREADFINCQIWRKPAETLANYTQKGSMVGVRGRLLTGSYDNKQGQKVYTTEVVVEEFQLLDTKKDNQGTSQQNYQQPQSNQQQHYQNNNTGQQNNMPNFDKNSDPFGNAAKIDISDDDLPF